MRVNLSVPGPLLARLRAERPGLNLSAVLRTALSELVEGCAHDELECGECAVRFDRRAFLDEALSVFYGEAAWRVNELASVAGTAEGAARVLREVARGFGISKATTMPVYRPTRRARQAALDAKLAELDVDTLPRRARSLGRRSA